MSRKSSYRFRFAAGLAVGAATLSIAACDRQSEKNVNVAPTEPPSTNSAVEDPTPAANTGAQAPDAGGAGPDAGTGADASAEAPEAPDSVPTKNVNVRPHE